MTSILLSKRKFIIFSLSSSTIFNGFHNLHYSTSICSSFSKRRLQPQRRLPFTKQQQQQNQQMCSSKGSFMPLFCINHTTVNCTFHCSNCKASSFLPSSCSFDLFKEKLLGFNYWGFCSSNDLGHGFSISSDFDDVLAKSMVFNAKNGVLNCEFLSSVCNSNWGLSKIGFCDNKFVGFGYGGQFRGFSSCREERESDDDEVSEDSEGGYKSRADPEEVGRVAKVIEELFALDRNMEAVLDECSIDLSHDLVVDVLERFRHARKPAFRFFCWAGGKQGFSHDSRTYNAMLTILGKTRQFETMGALLEEMGDKGVLDMDSFVIAMKAYAAGKERKKAVGVLELMKAKGFIAGVETINLMLSGLGRAKLVKEAQALHDRLKGRFTPNVKTYCVLLSGWCQVKNLMEAGKIWNEMIDQGMKPDVVAHNTMLGGLLKLKKRSDAIKLFTVMKAKGPAPNVRSYAILIEDLCKHSKMKEAIAFFDEMQDSGCEPDAAVYTSLITGFGNIRKMDMVHGLLKEMKEKGYPLDGQLYTALIKLMTNRRMPDDALRIYKKMIRDGIQPTFHTYNMMMKSYFLAGNSEMACSVWDEMIQKGCCPDENAYTVLIGGLIRHGRSKEACKFVEEMINKGMRVPELDFNKFAADFCRVGRPNILEELARKMRLSGNSEVSEVFARWAQMTQKKVTNQRHD